MKSILKEIADKNKKQEIEENADPVSSNNRRSFIKKAALGGIAIGGLMKLSIEDTIAQTTSKV